MLEDSFYPRSPKKKNEEEEAAVPSTPSSPKATKPAWLVLEETRDRDLAIAVNKRKNAQAASKTIYPTLWKGDPLTIAKALLKRDAGIEQLSVSGWFELVTTCAQMIVDKAKGITRFSRKSLTQEELIQCLNTLLAFAHLPHTLHPVPQVLKMLLERALGSPTPVDDSTFLQQLRVIAALHNRSFELLLKTLQSKYMQPNSSDLWKKDLLPVALGAVEQWESILGTACLLHSHAQACILRSDDVRADATHQCLMMLMSVARQLQHSPPRSLD
jgi:hypothetical protein